MLTLPQFFALGSICHVHLGKATHTKKIIVMAIKVMADINGILNFITVRNQLPVLTQHYIFRITLPILTIGHYCTYL